MFEGYLSHGRAPVYVSDDPSCLLLGYDLALTLDWAMAMRGRNRADRECERKG